MPEFSNPFQGNKNERKLTKEELIRAIRFSIASEYEAIQLYEQLKDSTDDTKAKKLLEEVVEDEKIHIGNFNYLLEILSPDDREHFVEGLQEAQAIIEDED